MLKKKINFNIYCEVHDKPFDIFITVKSHVRKIMSVRWWCPFLSSTHYRNRAWSPSMTVCNISTGIKANSSWILVFNSGKCRLTGAVHFAFKMAPRENGGLFLNDVRTSSIFWGVRWASALVAFRELNLSAQNFQPESWLRRTMEQDRVTSQIL